MTAGLAFAGEWEGEVGVSESCLKKLLSSIQKNNIVMPYDDNGLKTQSVFMVRCGNENSSVELFVKYSLFLNF